MKGYVQIYTGNGKGKTTAALGLALRAVGAGLNVYIGQFIKGMHYSELDSLNRYSDLITIKQFGRDCFIHNNPTDEDCQLAQNGFKEMKEVINSGKYQLVVLDEISIATNYKLISVDDVLTLIQNKPENVEIVITGRNVDPSVMEAANLVTEMREVKHYFQEGVQAREGIEK